MYLQTSPECRYCGASISQNERRLGSVCRDWRCRRTELEDDLRQFRDEQARTEGRSDADRFDPVVIPYSPRDLVPLPSARRAQFLEYLDALIEGEDPELPDSVRQAIDAVARVSSSSGESTVAEAESDADPDTEAEPDTHTGPDTDTDSEPEPDTASAVASIGLSLCAACRGVCCQDGESHAFLDARRVWEIRTQHQWSPDELRTKFESFFPKVSTENGCVFQAPDGCTVPREARSHLCNRYACSGLKRAEERVQNGATQIFAAARVDNRIQSGVFLVVGDDS